LGFANVDSVSDHHPVEVQITAVSEIGVMPIPEHRGSVKAETSPTSPEELEVVISPAAATPAPAVEIISPPSPDLPSETRRASAFIEVSIASEAALEPAVTKDSKPSGDGEQRHADMDVDEELLNLIGDDSLSRNLHPSPTKQEPSSPQDKYPSSLLPVKQESAPSILAPPHLSPAATTILTSQEGLSMLSPDTALSVRDSEPSAVKLDERSAPKKKVSCLALVFNLLFWPSQGKTACTTQRPRQAKWFDEDKAQGTLWWTIGSTVEKQEDICYCNKEISYYRSI
jgi:hypothetical protein